MKRNRPDRQNLWLFYRFPFHLLYGWRRGLGLGPVILLKLWGETSIQRGEEKALCFILSSRFNITITRLSHPENNIMHYTSWIINTSSVFVIKCTIKFIKGFIYISPHITDEHGAIILLRKMHPISYNHKICFIEWDIICLIIQLNPYNVLKWKMHRFNEYFYQRSKI